VKTGQSLSKMSKPTALHAEGTAQGSEWLNISDTAKKLYSGKSNSGIAVPPGDNDQIANRDLKLMFISIRKVKTEEEKVKQTHRFKDRISVIQQR